MLRRLTALVIVAVCIAIPAAAIAQEEGPQISVFTDSGINEGNPGERGNAVGVFDPPACPQAEDLPPNVGRVFIFFDGKQVAEAAGHSDPPGFSGGIFDIPRDAKPGPDHTVSASCDSSGKPVKVQGRFTVLGAGGPTVVPKEKPPTEVLETDRSAFASSVPDAREAFNDRTQLLKNLMVAVLLMLLVFPSQLFNSTLEEHYDEVRRWFGFGRRERGERAVRPRALRFLTFLLFAVVGSIVYGFLDPEFGPSRLTLSWVLLAGVFASIVVTTIAFVVLPGFIFNRGQREAGHLKVLPGTLVVAVVCVAVSRLVHFLPGYFYGLIAAFAISRGLSKRETGLNTLLAAVITLIVAIGAWLAWIPIKDSALEPGAGAGLLVLDAVLVATFVAGLEAVVFGLIPMRFLPGEKIFTWNKPLWGIVFLIGVLGFVQVIVRSNATGTSQPNSLFTTVALFLVFGLVSVLFWGYFRLRKPKAPGAPGADPAAPPQPATPATPAESPVVTTEAAPPAESVPASAAEETPAVETPAGPAKRKTKPAARKPSTAKKKSATKSKPSSKPTTGSRKPKS
jgi:hypothetical protein